MFTMVYICPVATYLRRQIKNEIATPPFKNEQSDRKRLHGHQPGQEGGSGVDFRFEARGKNLLKIISGKVPANQKLRESR